MHWADFLCKQSEELSRSLGFDEARIREPTKIFFYNDQALTLVPREKRPAERKRIQKNIKSLINGVISNRGYNERKGDYHIKKL